MTPDGLIGRPSLYDGPETVKRLRAAVAERGMAVFADIDHAAGAVDAGLSLRPMEVLIFGNAKAGTLLMQAMPTIAIDLPLKVLVWEAVDGTTWLAYTDPAWLVARHGGWNAADPIVDAMRTILAAVAERATGGKPAARDACPAERPQNGDPTP